MSKKVLVFESDAAFAAELRSELGKLDCTTLIVDDGNVGLQQAAAERPDLILLSIELPRMNGFSVCNKLKKDAALKDVPLIIMSSESSEETFEQHRKLRTRAEDYVHKPIAFGELLRHISPFVQLRDDAGSSSDDLIVLDDELSLSGMDLSVDDPESTQDLDDDHTQIGARPAFFANKTPGVNDPDTDVDAFADAAFGRLTGDGDAPAKPKRSVPPPLAAPIAEVKPLTLPEVPVSRRPTTPPVTAAPISVTLPPVETSHELDELRAALEAAKSRAADAERELSEAKTENARLDAEAQRGGRTEAEVQRLHRELDEMKTKLSSNTRAGAVSSREFLDLREALNKKDKELLGLREQLTKKDKEIFEIQDRSLLLERAKADTEDKTIELERESSDLKEKVEALSADKELAKKVGEDAKQRAERFKTDLDVRTRELAELKSKAGDEKAAHDAALAAAKAEAEARVLRMKEEHTGELSALEEARKAEQEKAAKDAAAALAAAKTAFEKEKLEAVSSRESALRSEHQADIAARDRAHKAELEVARKAAGEELIQTKVQAEQKREEAVRAAEEAAEADKKTLLAAHANQLSSIEAAHKAAMEALVRAHEETLEDRAAKAREKQEADARESAEKIAALENDRDARIFALEAKAKAELADATDSARAERETRDARIAQLELDLAAVRGELAELDDAKKRQDAAAEARIKELASVAAAESEVRRGVELEKAELDEKLLASEARAASLEKELADAQKRAADAKSEFESTTALLEKARIKWSADKSSLEKATESLALAVRQIQEATDRPFAG